VGVAVGLGVGVGVGSTAGAMGWRGVVSTVAVGDRVGFGVSGFGTGVALGATAAAGIIFGVMTGVAETAAVEVGDDNAELTPLTEAN
jgi:hypothetical protein